MSCPRPVGALGQGTFSTALVVGGHSCLPTKAWVVGIMPDGVGGTWRLAADIQATPKGLACNCSMLSPGGGKALCVTYCYFAYLVSRCFSRNGEHFGNASQINCFLPYRSPHPTILH